MMLFIQCLTACVLFTVLILPAQYRNPLSQFASYPTAIKKRVYELPKYKDFIASVEQKNWKRKIAGAFLVAVFLGGVAYFSGKRTFEMAFYHVFVLFFAVNMYDLIVFDLIIFCHSRKLMIPGTEDMKEEYKDPKHHILGAAKVCAIGTVVALVSAAFVILFSVIV